MLWHVSSILLPSARILPPPAIVITFCVDVIKFCRRISFCGDYWNFASILLHFAAIITFCFNFITFCINIYILRRLLIVITFWSILLHFALVFRFAGMNSNSETTWNFYAHSIKKNKQSLCTRKCYVFDSFFFFNLSVTLSPMA